jgi:Co/Zn/Cd efflux system component/copper chaperone CopZ
MQSSDLKRSTFKVAKMDCPAEVELINLSLSGYPVVKQLDFDLDQRILTVVHEGDIAEVADKVDSLGLESNLLQTQPFEGLLNTTTALQSRILIQVLLINLLFFVLEFVVGWLADSMGLVADSLDMLSDALVYGLSLLAVSKSTLFKKQVAKLAGIFQILLAAGGFIEVIRRFVGVEAAPDFLLMIVMSFFALLANTLCLYLLRKSVSSEVHMKASMIFTSNDIIINAGVIVGGILVFATSSPYPDLVVGGLVFLIVLRGAFRILQLSK